MVKLDNIDFSYNNKKNIFSSFSLEVKENEFVTLLGPSGCGKTTLLRLIAGFIFPEKGRVVLDGVNQERIPAHKRNIGFVFQDYALFPHLNVFKNISYPLFSFLGGMKKEKIKNLVLDIAKKLDLDMLLDRFPSQLSGGQQQRVALARSLIQKPKVLLMDEPLSGLDLALRQSIRQEIKKIQKEFNITTIYVTHDREEAFYLSDRIAIINNGVLEQYNKPFLLYYEPCNRFVANITGDTNYFIHNNTKTMVRPEWFEVSKDSNASSILGIILSKQFLGEKVRLCVDIGKKQIVNVHLSIFESKNYECGKKVYINIRHKVDMDF